MTRKRRVMVLVHANLVPPDSVEGVDLAAMEWKTEYDVVTGLRQLGHDVLVVGVHDDLLVIRHAVDDGKPHIVFNLLEEFSGVTIYDQNVVSYLELLGVPYTGSNPRGLMLARDKPLAKKILHYHRIAIPEFITVP
ncbi:MAG: D-alanine--D-alanine ligase, partial [Nitrospirota bacterium]